MKKSFFYLFLSCLGFTMCKQKPETQTELVIEVNFDRPEKASFFDFFRSIELIPLETSPDVLLAGVSKLVVHDDRYYTLDRSQDIIHVFDEKGNFIFKIDKKGQGPGEYNFIEDFIFNPFSGNLELFEAYGAVYIFDLSGNFIEKKRIEYDGFRVAHNIAAIDKNTHVFYVISEPVKIIYFNLDEGKLLHLEFEESRELGGYVINSFYSFQDECFFFRPVHPVVYKAGKERLEDFFKFDFGKYTKEGRNATFTEESKRSLTKQIEEMFAQTSYVIRKVRHNNNYVFALISWKTWDRKTNVIYNKSTGKAKFILDFDEKAMFDPEIITDEYVLTICRWVDLEKFITKEMLDDTQKKIFEALVQSKDEANPILIKYWFK